MDANSLSRDKLHVRIVANTQASGRFVGKGLALAGITVDADTASPDAVCVCLIGNSTFGAAEPTIPIDIDAIEGCVRNGTKQIIIVTDALVRSPDWEESPGRRKFREELLWLLDFSARASRRGVSSSTLKIGYSPEAGHNLEPRQITHLLRYQPIRKITRSVDLIAPFRLLLSGKAKYLVGSIFYIDGGAHLGLIPPLRYGQISKSYPLSKTEINSIGRLDGQTILVTGASSGIGRAAVVELARRNADVVLVARRVGLLRDIANVVEAAGQKAWIVPADLTKENEAKHLIRRAIDMTGRKLNGVAYAAGQLGLTDPNDATTRIATLQLNFYSPVALMSDLLMHWKAEKLKGGFVMVSSIASTLVPVPQAENYASSKAAVTQYLRSLAATVGRYDFRFNAVCPGIIDTVMGGTAQLPYQRGWMSRVPLRRVGQPEEVASVIGFLLSPGAELITGNAIVIDGGFSLDTIAGLDDMGAIFSGSIDDG